MSYELIIYDIFLPLMNKKCPNFTLVIKILHEITYFVHFSLKMFSKEAQTQIEETKV